MVATGFLSLNVHEALHFDGTPLCLHPDLLVSSDSASHATTLIAGNLPPRGKDDKGPSSHSEKHEKAIPQVGDLLEIRVWDPLTSQSNASNVASILRPRGSYESIGISANSSASTNEVRSSSVTMTKPPPPLETAESATLDSSDAPVPELLSQQQPSPSSQTAKSVVAPSSALAKPPMQRRVTAPLPDRSRPKPNAKHVRDVSEMTVDSVVYASSVDSHPSDTEKVDEVPPGNGTGGHEEENDDEDEEDWYSTHQLRLSFVMVVTDKTWTSLKGSARTQVSLLRSVADLYQLSAYDIVTIHTIPPDDQAAVAKAVAIDFLLVTIKDQFISRGDMHYFQQCLIGSWVYQGQRLYEQTRGFQANAREIRRRDAVQALSGIVTESTVITFRSRSTRIIWLVQMSSEMWDYGPYDRGDSDEGRVCEIYFDRWITFIHKLFTKWKELEASHSLTVIFFDRSFLGGSAGPMSNALRDVYGRYYEDHFRIVLENETCPDWHSLIVQIKKAFVRYPLEVGWNLNHDETARRPSTASHGNVLEAINVTLNLLQFHYLDRDLQRTGNSIVIVSAGNGVFEVDRNLAGITYQRMMDNGIGSDMLSLGLPPLHIAPFFLYSNPPTSDRPEDSSTQEQFYEVPHWMHLSFVSYESDEAVFVDHLRDPKDEKRKEEAIFSRNSCIDIGPNGFLLPSFHTKTTGEVLHPSPLLKPTSYNIGGNVTSPVRKAPTKTNERRLIDGRDFRDILEACHPRNTVSIPSSLRAFLRISGVNPCATVEEEAKQAGHEYPEEWGSLDIVLSRETSLGSYKRDTAPFVPDFNGRLSPRHLSISPQRSIDDQMPSLSLNSDSSHFMATRLQRSSSITLHAGLDNVSSKTNSRNTASVVSSDDEDVDKHDEIMMMENAMRAMMLKHDSAVVSIPSPKLVSKSEQPRADLYAGRGDDRGNRKQLGAHVGSNLLHRPGQAAPAVSGGGLGAALKQYKFASPSNFLLDADRGNSVLSRTTSLFGLSGNTGQSSLRRIADMGAKGLSPLLLPPAVDAQSKPIDHNHEVVPPDEIPHGRTFLHPKAFTAVQKSSARMSSSNTDIGTSLMPSDTISMGSLYSLSSSPPTKGKFGSPPTDKPVRYRSEPEMSITMKPKGFHRGVTPQQKAHVVSRRKKLFNPFRQQDEDEVLAMKSHNRRRWSHVFPLGEVEFKRHAGPNWKSLTAPAILPLSIDYFPKQEEIDHHFTTGFHNVTLSEFEHKNFSSNKDLLVEMVRQRLTQDFQVIPDDCIDTKRYRMEPLEGGIDTPDAVLKQSTGSTSDAIRFFLSMGHRLHTITYHANRDIIEVRRYDAKETQINYTVNYQYLSFCQETKKYSKCRQTFSKYTDQYNWNKVDNIICGDDDREMREGMRFKRLMFGIIPDNFQGDQSAEEAYVAKFRRFMDYLGKLRDKDESNKPLNIRFVTSVETQNQDESRRLESMPGVERGSMVRFYVQLLKGKRDNLEWMEVALDTTFDTSWSYRIMFNWLVASSGKVDTQVQLLQRRCVQYGLRLVPFPQISVSKNSYLNPFKAPAIFTIRHKADALTIDRKLCQIDLVYDGVFVTDVGAILECLDDSDEFLFPRRRGSQIISTMGKQFVHRSGTFFVRVLRDLNDLVIFVVLGNYRYMMMNRDETMVATYQTAFQSLSKLVSTL